MDEEINPELLKASNEIKIKKALLKY